MQLLCPVCKQPLASETPVSGLKCPDGHSFDRAKQGYYNLLLVQKKRSKDPGDNVEMVAARTRFLESGYYQPVSDALNQLASKHLNSQPLITDLGCGEGYYTARLAEALSSSQPEILGIDISKHAVKVAARRRADITWIVGSSADIPLADASVDFAVIVFSKILSDELERALKPGALVCIAYPGADHLYSLRQAIYTEVRESSSNPAKQLSDHFELIEEVPTHFEIALQGQQQINDLLAMTPHGQRIRAEKRAAILALEQLTTQVDIKLALYRYIS